MINIHFEKERNVKYNSGDHNDMKIKSIKSAVSINDIFTDVNRGI